MPPDQGPTQVAFLLILLGVLSIILGAWAWAIGRIASGRGLLPPAPIRVVPWRGKHVLGMLVLFFVVKEVVAIGFLAAGLVPMKGAGPAANPTWAILAMAAINAAFLLVAAPLLLWATGAGPADLGVERGRIGINIIRGLVAWPLLAPIVFGVNLLALTIWHRRPHPLEEMINRDTPSALGLAAVSAVVLAPLVEEFVFRGLLLGWLGRWASGLGRPPVSPAVPPEGPLDSEFGAEPAPPDLPPGVDLYIGPGPDLYIGQEADLPPKPAPLAGQGWRFLAANVFVSLVFAALHGPVWPSPVPLFFLSLGLGVLYQRTGGLVAPVTLHATFNGLSTLLMVLSLQAGGPRPPAVPPEATMPRLSEAATPPRPFRIET